MQVNVQIEAARFSVAKQFILITPQDMGNVAMGSDIRVHRYFPVLSFLTIECVILSEAKVLSESLNIVNC